jgi:hypothetical protein
MSYTSSYNVIVTKDSVTYSRPFTGYSQQIEDTDDVSPVDSKSQPKGYKVIPHTNSVVVKCPAKNFACKTVKRSGLTFYTTIKGVKYFSMAIDETYGTLTDPGGKIFANDEMGYEDPIQGGARETKEETLDMYDYTTNAAFASLKASATVIYNPKMCMVFQPVVMDDPMKDSVEFHRRYTKFNGAIRKFRESRGGKLAGEELEAKLASFEDDEDAIKAFTEENDKKLTVVELDSKYRYAENRGLIWLTENELNTLVTLHPKQEPSMPIPERLIPYLGKGIMPRLYERVRSLLYVVLSNSSSII